MQAPSKSKLSVSRGRVGFWLVFWASAFVLGMISLRLITAGYVSEETIQDVAKVRIAIANFSSLPGLLPQYPELSFFVELAAAMIPGISPGTAPFALSCVCGAALLAAAYVGLRRRERGVLKGLLIVSLIAFHPFFLWTMTDSPRLAIASIAYAFTFAGLAKLRGADEMRGYFLAAFGMAVGFLSMPGFAYFVAAILLLLPAFVSSRILRSSASAGYYATFFPFVASVLSVMYLGWVMLGSAPTFWSLMHTGLHLLPDGPVSSPWLLSFGNSPFLGLLWLAGLMAFCFPVIFLCRKIGTLEAAAVVIAGAIATSQFGVASPTEALASTVPLLIVVLPRVVPVTRDLILIPLLAIGMIAGWVSFSGWASVSQTHWTQALMGERVDPTYAGDIALGEWLSRSHEETMIDPVAGFPVMAASEDATRFFGAPRYQYDIQRGVLNAQQVAVSDPASPRGALDSINRRFPSVYRNGIEGFSLVYQGRHWKVYRRLAENTPVTLDREASNRVSGWFPLLGGISAWEKLALLAMVLFSLSLIRLQRIS